jgi:hypothetical protein
LLDRFPVPASIMALGKEAFVAAAWGVVGRKVAKARLLGDIYETARSSVALPIAPDAPAIAMFRLVIAEARHLIRQRDQIEHQAVELPGAHADFQRLQQIPGIGPVNALTILAEAGDLRRFGHHRQFLKFCGLDLATHQSGQFRGKTKLSKRGNARLRRALWMAAQVAIRQRENSFRAKFERYVAKDRDDPDLRRKAFTAITAHSLPDIGRCPSVDSLAYRGTASRQPRSQDVHKIHPALDPDRQRQANQIFRGDGFNGSTRWVPSRAPLNPHHAPQRPAGPRDPKNGSHRAARLRRSSAKR